MEIVIWMFIFAILGLFALYLIFPIVLGALMLFDGIFGGTIEKWQNKNKK